jgi:hypothetical protein
MMESRENNDISPDLAAKRKRVVNALERVVKSVQQDLTLLPEEPKPAVRIIHPSEIIIDRNIDIDSVPLDNEVD